MSTNIWGNKSQFILSVYNQGATLLQTSLKLINNTDQISEEVEHNQNGKNWICEW